MTGRTTQPAVRAALRRICGGGITTVVLVALSVGGLGGPAGAAVPSGPPTADCTQLTAGFDDTVASARSGTLYGSQAAAVGSNLKKLAGKVSDKKLKKALLSLAGFYADLGKAKNIPEAARVSVSRAGSYVKAMRVFTAAVTACAAAAITVPPND
ncbi:MAG: hypothetical protein ACKOA9_09840 [Actinomycetota bacterium]